jgi:hypothetical protein
VPGGGGADDDGDGIPNINDPCDSSYYGPGGGGDTSYCGSYSNTCGVSIPNVSCPDYPNYSLPGGGGADDDGDGVPNINDPDAPNYSLPGGGGDTSCCGDGVPNLYCPGYPHYSDPGGGGADDDGDGIPNINDPDAPSYHLPEGGGDTTYCGEGILNIYCPDYPNYDDRTADTSITVTYGAAPFWINSLLVGKDIKGILVWRSFNLEGVAGDEDGGVTITGVGVARILCTRLDDRRSLLLSVRVEVLPKQLTIVDTWVDTLKASDGKRDAEVLPGSLQGLLPADVGSVTVSASASYANTLTDISNPITVTYRLAGNRAYCYREPAGETYTGKILPKGSNASDVRGIVIKQEEVGGAYTPWPGVRISYTINGDSYGELTTDANGRYFLSGLGEGDAVKLMAPEKHSYTCAPQQQTVVATLKFVQATTISYMPDGVSMTQLALRDSEGNVLVNWAHEEINDTLFYQLPCNQNGVEQLGIACDLPSGISGSFSVWADAVASGVTDMSEVAEAVEVAPAAQAAGTPQVEVDVSRAGRRVITIALNDANNSADTLKRYTLVLNKNFDLFDVVNEHLGNLRVVNTNPATNRTGLVFSACTWWHKRDAGEWFIGEEKQLYYTAGTSILDKFTEKDSMFLVLSLPDGSLIETCPDANLIEAATDGGENGSDDSDGNSSASKKSVKVAVYPNPVPSGGTVKFKQVNLFDSEDEDNRYVKYSLFDTQGRLVLRGDASPLYEGQGLIMPQLPGIYHLLLESKAGKRWVVKVAVSDKRWIHSIPNPRLAHTASCTSAVWVISNIVHLIQFNIIKLSTIKKNIYLCFTVL